MARQRYYRSSARCCRVRRVSADRAARPGPHTRGRPRLLDLGRRIRARDRFAPDSPLEESGFEPSVPRHGELMKFALTPCRSGQDSNFRSPATVRSVGALWRSVASGEIGAPERAPSSAISSARRDSRTRRRRAFFRRNMMFQLANVPSSDPLTIFGPRTPWIETAASMFMLCSTAIRWLSQAISGHGAYISQDNRLIFLNNSLILAKGWSARLSRRRRWDFRHARGKPAALARARARLIGGKLTSKNGGNAGFLPCYFPFWPGKAALRHQESFPIPMESTHLGRGSRI